MTEEEMAEEYAKSIVVFDGDFHNERFAELTQAFLAGLRAGSENHSKIYMLGRKDERERPSALCGNPMSICKRCDCHKTLCEGSDFGAYIGECESFVYKE